MSPTREQSLRALDRANEIRLRRAEVRRWVARPGDPDESMARAIAVLREQEPATRTLAVGDFLLWPRRWGRNRARKLLVRLQIPETKPLGGLTERQVRLLADALGWAPPPRGA